MNVGNLSVLFWTERSGATIAKPTGAIGRTGGAKTKADHALLSFWKNSRGKSASLWIYRDRGVDMARAWGRLYLGTRNHRKIKTLRRRHPHSWKTFYVLLEMALEADDEGWIYLAPGVPYPLEELADEVDETSETLQALLNTMEELGLIQINGQGIQFLSYNERQFKSDASGLTDRQERHRAKALQERYKTVIGDNAPVHGSHIQREQQKSGQVSDNITKTKALPKRYESVIPHNGSVRRGAHTTQNACQNTREIPPSAPSNEHQDQHQKSAQVYEKTAKNRPLPKRYASVTGHNGLITPDTDTDIYIYIDSTSSSSSFAEDDGPCPPTKNSSKKLYNQEFLRFWAAYPRKVGKMAAWRRWQALKKAGGLPNISVLLKAISWQVQQPSWQEEGGKFIPHPATWLNAGRWADEPPPDLVPPKTRRPCPCGSGKWEDVCCGQVQM